ncbi:hypothetical protein ES703_109450 [subsurface metagenome]
MVNRLQKRIKDSFKRIWEPSEVLFIIFWDAFFASIAVIIALRLVGYEGIAMDYFWVAVTVFAFCAIVTRLRIRMEPKDTRLDTLITNVATLTTEIQQLKGSMNNQLDKTTANQLITAIQDLTQELRERK